MTKTVDLTELKRLLAEATPGPWVLDKGGGHAYDRIIGGDVVQIHGTIAGRGSWSERVCENFGNLDLPGPAANVEIICALHNAAPAMIEELERLRDLHGICGHHCEACARRDDEIGELREQNDALRKDAERYRWLKSRKSHNVTLTDATGCRDKVVFVYMAENLDSAIEHAIAEEEKK